MMEDATPRVPCERPPVAGVWAPCTWIAPLLELLPLELLPLELLPLELLPLCTDTWTSGLSSVGLLAFAGSWLLLLSAWTGASGLGAWA